MKENVIISLADSNYFELLNELVDSLKQFKESENTAICIMDAGLTNEQKSILSSKVDEIKPADWDIEGFPSTYSNVTWLFESGSIFFNFPDFLSSAINLKIL